MSSLRLTTSLPPTQWESHVLHSPSPAWVHISYVCVCPHRLDAYLLEPKPPETPLAPIPLVSRYLWDRHFVCESMLCDEDMLPSIACILLMRVTRTRCHSECLCHPNRWIRALPSQQMKQQCTAKHPDNAPSPCTEFEPKAALKGHDRFIVWVVNTEGTFENSNN